jgi:PTH1 family peptidyl-tRNA hydrolase
MGWLIKQPQFSVNPATQLYTLGQQRTVLVVGLGNPGAEHDGTRHNIGFMCLDAFVAAHEELDNWTTKKALKCHLIQGRLGDTQMIAIKPTTFMNLSGEAVQAVCHFYKIPPENVVVIHDELDIPFGQIRLRLGGSSAGHNGIKSVTQSIGEDYGRVRIGIGPKKPVAIDSADFVLKTFTKSEHDQLSNLTQEVNAILVEYLYSGQLPQETRNFLV